MRKTLLMAALAATSLLAGPAMASQTNGYGVATSAYSRDFFTSSSVVSAYRTAQDSSFNYTRMADVPSVQHVGCEAELANAAANGFSIICGGTTPGTTGPGFDQTSSQNAVTFTNSLRHDLPGLLTSSVFSQADLSTGKLGVEAISVFRHGAAGVAQFSDTLNFNIAGATATSITNIMVSFTLDGTLLSPPGAASIREALNFGNASATVTHNLGNGGDSSIFGQSGWVSYSWNNSNSSRTKFTGIYALSGASQTLGIYNYLQGESGNGGASLYGHTSALSFNLPSNVNFTSNSGVFLQGLGTPGGVPEPASWALMIAGFGLTGAAMRRRAKVQAVLA